MGFLPANFQLATPFRSRINVNHGPTDTHSDRRRLTIAAPNVSVIKFCTSDYYVDIYITQYQL